MAETVEVLASVKAFLNREQKLLIGGQWVTAVSGETFATLNPADGSVLSQVASGGQADVDLAVQAAQAAFPAWAALMPAQRERLLHRFADLIAISCSPDRPPKITPTRVFIDVRTTYGSGWFEV